MMTLQGFEIVTSMGNASVDWVFFGTFLILLIAILLYAIKIPQGNHNWWILSGLAGVLVLIGMFIHEGWGRVLLLDAAAFVAVGLVWVQESAQAKKAARSFLFLMIIAVAFLLAGLYLTSEGTIEPQYPLNKVAASFLFVGFCLKLALIPFYFWLPNIAEHSKPMTTALIISIIDIAAFSELVHLRSVAPWLFTNYATFWLAISLLSMFGGAILALAQKDIKRMLAFSTIDDMGYLLLGTLVGTQIGIDGAILAALSHAIFKVLLFGAVGVAEYRIGHALTLDDSGLASQNPISASVFILGAFGMLGVPPLFGFIGRWRLYLSGIEYGGVALVITMACATALALLYYVRVIHSVWLGKPEEAPLPSHEPVLAAVVMIILLLIMLALGLFPGWLTRLL
jgi:multicomponent Na+:H+ antiporter subunit D